MEKEYGGYLPIELNRGKEYYCGSNVMTFNCARNAIKYIVEKKGFNKIYIPFYMCESVRNRLSDKDIEISYYHINVSMKPEIDTIEDYAVIMIPDYFGIVKHNKETIKQYKHIIFDNTQAFFEEPVEGEYIYNVYSCRKFFGVCDGAYLVGPNIKKENLEPYKPEYARYMLDSITYGTNEIYKMSLKNEELLEERKILGMSKLSHKILEGIDYNNIKKRRRNNFQYVHKQLASSNELSINLEEGCVPMVYPYLIENEKLRAKLLESQIYVPQWWKYILKEEGANDFERYLCRYLIPLPIDQRYNIREMECILDVVKKNNSNGR